MGQGLRGGGLQGRLPGGDPARGRRPAGCPLQHDQLGRPRHPRLVLRRLGHRSAHRRDHQGLGALRVPAGPPGHADLRGARRRRPGRQGRPQRSGAGLDHPPARAVRPRGRPHPGLRPQLRRLHAGPPVGDGLPGALGEADGRPRSTSSDAYGKDIGDWDRFLVEWLYADVPPGPAGEKALAAKAKAASEHLRFVQDDDARPVESGHPAGGIWDDGSDSWWPSSTG